MSSKNLICLFLIVNFVLPPMSYAQGREPARVRPQEKIQVERPTILDVSPFKVDIQPIKIDLDDIMCSIPRIDLGSLNDTENSSVMINCWGERNPNASEKELFDYEGSVCSCLKQKSATNSILDDALKHPSSVITPVGSRASGKLGYLQENLDAIKKDLQAQRDSLGFQASIISNGQEGFSSIFSNVSLDQVVNVPKSELGDSSSENSVGSLGGTLGLTAFSNQVLGSLGLGISYGKMPGIVHSNGNVSLNEKEKNEARDLINDAGKALSETKEGIYRDKDFDRSNGQCVGNREYLAYKEFPSDQNLFKSMQGTAFQSSDWDYDSLYSEFRGLTSLSLPEKKANREKILQLKAKLLFLKRNPMIKSFLMAKDDNSDYFMRSNTTGDEKIKIEATYNKTNIPQKKQELFDIIKSFVNDGGRKSPKEIEDYKSKLVGFFSDESVGIITRVEADKNVLKSVDDFSANDPLVPKVDKIVNYKDLEDRFIGASEKQSPRTTCTKSSIGDDLATCVDIYAMYCPMLSEVERNRREKHMENDDLYDDIDSQTKNDYVTDIKENADLAAFNKRVCDTPRKMKGFLNFSKMTFNEYRQSYCSKKPQDPDCGSGPESYANLRKKYFESSSPLSGKKDEVVEGFANFNTTQMDQASANRVSSSEMDVSTMQRTLSDFRSSTVQRSIASTQDPSLTNENSLYSSSASTQTSGKAAVNSANGYMASSAMINPGMDELSSDKDLSEEDKERVRSMAQEEISKNNKTLENPELPPLQRSSLDERNKTLEALLAQKNETASKYQELIAQLSKRVDELSNSDSKSNSKTGANKNQKSAAPQEDYLDSPNSFSTQAVNSVSGVTNNSQNTSVGGGSLGGGASATASSFNSGAISSGRSSPLSGANTALLDAMMAKGSSSSDGTTILIKDGESQGVSAIENAAGSSSQFSLNVPATVYAQFQSEDVEVLSKYKDEILKKIDSNQPVRLTVKNGDKSLNIIVVSRNGKLVYLPSRVFSLSSLQQELQSTTGGRAPAGQ